MLNGKYVFTEAFLPPAQKADLQMKIAQFELAGKNVCVEVAPASGAAAREGTPELHIRDITLSN